MIGEKLFDEIWNNSMQPSSFLLLGFLPYKINRICRPLARALFRSWLSTLSSIPCHRHRVFFWAGQRCVWLERSKRDGPNGSYPGVDSWTVECKCVWGRLGPSRWAYIKHKLWSWLDQITNFVSMTKKQLWVSVLPLFSSPLVLSLFLLVHSGLCLWSKIVSSNFCGQQWA